jgi:hypothetical protein
MQFNAAGGDSIASPHAAWGGQFAALKSSSGPSVKVKVSFDNLLHRSANSGDQTHKPFRQRTHV